eukprot:scaffold167112_cov27-Tisochrysis_lutea.AAC.1
MCRDWVTSDMPEHSCLRFSRDDHWQKLQAHISCKPGGRNIDTTARGLGGSIGCPLTTCGEENLIMVDD